MKYNYYCGNCEKSLSRDIDENICSFTCECASNVNVINEKGIERYFQIILDKGIPKDKNDEEVSVGNIVKVERSHGTCFGVIEWKFGRGYYISYKTRYDPKLDKMYDYLCSGDIEPDHEIIGNIYINPQELRMRLGHFFNSEE